MQHTHALHGVTLTHNGIEVRVPDKSENTIYVTVTRLSDGFKANVAIDSFMRSEDVLYVLYNIEPFLTGFKWIVSPLNLKEGFTIGLSLYWSLTDGEPIGFNIILSYNQLLHWVVEINDKAVDKINIILSSK